MHTDPNLPGSGLSIIVHTGHFLILRGHHRKTLSSNGLLTSSPPSPQQHQHTRHQNHRPDDLVEVGLHPRQAAEKVAHRDDAPHPQGAARHVKKRRDGVWKPQSPLRRKPQFYRRPCGFVVCASSFGGSDGRAQALPVTLRVPRSSTPVRAAAQCGSWSAVVHQAQLEINMTQSIATGTSAANPHTAQELLDTIQLMDSLSQEGFSKIGSIARLVLRSLDKPSPRQTEDLSNALRAIWHQSDDSMNCINCQAEVFGANFKGESHA